jgi:hypothetical protein
MKNQYEIVVGNVGVLIQSSLKIANKEYKEWVQISKNNSGRAAGEDVCLMKNGEIIKEYFGNLQNND